MWLDIAMTTLVTLLISYLALWAHYVRHDRFAQLAYGRPPWYACWPFNTYIAWKTRGNTCRHCKRPIQLVDGYWVDPEATDDDSIWRETCDSNETFTAEHVPEG